MVGLFKSNRRRISAARRRALELSLRAAEHHADRAAVRVSPGMARQRSRSTRKATMLSLSSFKAYSQSPPGISAMLRGVRPPDATAPIQDRRPLAASTRSGDAVVPAIRHIHAFAPGIDQNGGGGCCPCVSGTLGRICMGSSAPLARVIPIDRHARIQLIDAIGVGRRRWKAWARAFARHGDWRRGGGQRAIRPAERRIRSNPLSGTITWRPSGERIGVRPCFCSIDAAPASLPAAAAGSAAHRSRSAARRLLADMVGHDHVPSVGSMARCTGFSPCPVDSAGGSARRPDRPR